MIEHGVLFDEEGEGEANVGGSAGDSLRWYLELRKFGSVPHSGWGLGFERLILYLTGLTNIRDVIPVYRTPGHCKF